MVQPRRAAMLLIRASKPPFFFFSCADHVTIVSGFPEQGEINDVFQVTFRIRCPF